MVVTVIERAGLPCQLEDPYYPGYANIPCKFGPDGNLSPEVVANSGYPLQPGKVIKLDVKLLTHSLANGGVYDWTFTIDGETYQTNEEIDGQNGF